MAHITFNFFSEALGVQTTAEIIIPQKSTLGEIGINNAHNNGKFKCLYLLHGLSDDQTIWMRRTSIERYAADYGICVVMPFGARSFYSDMTYGMKYYTYIAKELPRIIEDTFNVSSKREDRFIGGLSMGGYGALKIALTETDKYAAAFGLSAVTDINNDDRKEVLFPIFGGTIPESADVFALAEKHNSDSVKPRIYTTIGRDDFLYKENILFKEHMEALDYDYTFNKTDGAHSWDVWDITVQDALKWIFE